MPPLTEKHSKYQYMSKCPYIIVKVSVNNRKNSKKRCNAREGIRTLEYLRNKALNLAPLTWLGNPRPFDSNKNDLLIKIDYDPNIT